MNLKATRGLAALFVVSLIATTCAAQGQKELSRNDTESKVISDIHHINQMEIRLGTLAERKAVSGKIRRYGTLLHRDHSLADRKLLSAAKSAKFTLIEEPNVKADVDMEDRLTSMAGADFDREFLNAMEKGHRQAIALIKTAEATIKPPKVRSVLHKTAPILDEHHQLAMNLGRL